MEAPPVEAAYRGELAHQKDCIRLNHLTSYTLPDNGEVAILITYLRENPPHIHKQTKMKQDNSWETLPARNPGSHRKHYACAFLPLPCTAFSSPFLCDNKGLPLPLPLLSICGHCQRAEICVSQSSYHITKDPKLAKKALKIACSSTLYMEGKAKQPKWSARSGYWGMGHPSQGSVLYST